MKTILETGAATDTQLVEWSLTGDREAFGRIVERYQSLVCSITYGATGSVALSEDIAQETFLTAWRELAKLSDAARLRGWLCGIARNLVNNYLRRGQREPSHAAEPLDTIHEPALPEPLPSAEAVSREEETIVWNALGRIPDTYREPLILFYREGQSVERVAREMELSEDAVKQRLSRGRKLLTDEVAAFVEGTLKRTTPGKVFTVGVLAALPVLATTAKAATAGAAAGAAAAKGTGAAKSGFLAAWLAPFIGLVGGMAVSWLSIRGASTERERRAKKLTFFGLWIFVLAWNFAGQPAMRSLSRYLEWPDWTFYPVMAVFWWFSATVVVTVSIVMGRWILAIRQQSEEAIETRGAATTPMKPGTRLAMVVGLYLGFFSWLIYLAWRAHDVVWATIITAVMVGLGAWHFLHWRGRTGVAAMRVTAGHLAVIWGIILVIVNWRLDVWLASRRGVSLCDIYQLLPMWNVHLLTAGFCVWAGIVWAITKPKQKSSSHQ